MTVLTQIFKIKKRLLAASAFAALCACAGSSLLDDGRWGGTQKATTQQDQALWQDEYYTTTSGQYLSALIAGKQGDAGEALSYLNEAIGLSEPNQQLYQDAYTLALQSGEIERAARYADKMQADEERELIIAPELLRAVIALKSKNYDKAAELLQAVPQKGFGFLVVELLKAWNQYAQGEVPNVARIKKLAQQGGEFQLLMVYQLALLQEAVGDKLPKDQQKPYFPVLAESGYLPFHLAMRMVQYLEKTGQDDLKEQLIERYSTQTTMRLRQLPPYPQMTAQMGAGEVFYGIASLLLTINAYETAEVPLHLAEYLMPEQSAITYMRAQLAEKREEWVNAEELYQSLMGDAVYGSMAALQLTYLYQDQEKVEDALHTVSQLLEKYPQNMRFWLAKGDILRQNYNYEAAIDAYSAAIDTIEDKKMEHWPSFYSRAISYERAGQWNKAEADFLEALRLKPDQPDVLNYLGYSWLIQNRQVSQAKAMIEKAIAARPRDAHIIDSMGWAYHRLGNYQKAAEYLERAVALSPSDATINEHLGDVYWRLGLETQAKYQWQRALAMEPKEPGQMEAIAEKIAEGLPPVSAANSVDTQQAKSSQE